LRNSNKQHLILAKLDVNNASFFDNQLAKLQLNLLMQTIVTVFFVRSPPKRKVSSITVLNNCTGSLFNSDSVYGLLGNILMNFLAPYPLFFLSSLIKTRFLQRISFCYCLRWLRQQTSLMIERLQ